MASVSSLRHTVLRLLGGPSPRRTRAVTSARAWRLRGCWVAAPRAQATAWTRAWSSGGTIRLAAPARLIGQGKVPRGPPVAPTAHRAWRELHPRRRLAVGPQRLLRQAQD